jgi:hypothetical protein
MVKNTIYVKEKTHIVMNLGMVESIVQLEAVGVSMVLVLFSPVSSIPVVVLQSFTCILFKNHGYKKEI